MKLEIISPRALLFKGEVDSITLPGASGSLQILNNHAPIVSNLVAGRVKIRGEINLDDTKRSSFTTDGNETYLEIKSGTLELFKNKVILLTD